MIKNFILAGLLGYTLLAAVPETAASSGILSPHLLTAITYAEILDLPYITHYTAYDITGDGSYFLLSENHNFRAGFTEIVASDGTVLLPALDYQHASSWMGGIRYHLGYREGQVVVDAVERYRFHWGPMINRINDYQNGLFFVYAAQAEETTDYIDMYAEADHLKIYEEAFSPKLISFSDLENYDTAGYDYDSGFYLNYHPFDEDWWLEGGEYPAYEGESGPGIADWITTTAKIDSPNEVLAEAVAQSGYEMERVLLPWTEETKRNTEKLLRCQVADYYYVSADYTAFYIRGRVLFFAR